MQIGTMEYFIMINAIRNGSKPIQENANIIQEVFSTAKHN